VALGFIALGVAMVVVLSRRPAASAAAGGAAAEPASDHSSRGSSDDDRPAAHVDAVSAAESDDPARADYVAPDE
jgi:hypothetical protein